MKKNCLLGKKYLLLLLALFPLSLFAQTTIKQAPFFPSNNSIIRNYDSKIDIVYCDNNDSSSFMHIDHSTNNVICVKMPDDLKVNDFEIDGKKLYFCGNKQGYGFVGMFKITDFFFGTGNMQYYHINSGISADQGVDYITDLKRLEFTYYSTELHLLMIGEGYHGESGKTTHDCIMDMWFPSISSLRFKYTIEDTGYLSYDDVAVTDHYIVVSAHSIAAYDPLAHFLLPYAKPAGTGNSIFDGYSIPPPLREHYGKHDRLCCFGSI